MAPSSMRRSEAGGPSLGKRPNRGGIQKRKAGQDKDGDVSMNPGGGGERRSTRSMTSGKPGRAARPINRVPGVIYLKVHGLKQSKAVTNSGGGVPDLISFLERKATTMAGRKSQKPVTIRSTRSSGEFVIIGATREDADEILKLNTFTFAGAKLEITESVATPPAESAEVQETKGMLQAILSQRYLGATKLLKLDALSQDAALVQTGLLATSERAEKMFRALMKVCNDLFKTRKEKEELMQSISVADNGIDNVNQVLALAETFPDLKNLDLSRNQISTIAQLEEFKGRFRKLETLYLTGNPIETAEPQYAAKLMEWFPRLQDLSGVQVRTAEQVAASDAAAKKGVTGTNGRAAGAAKNTEAERLALLAKYYAEGKAIIELLAKQTGMTFPYAELCLTDLAVGWDYEKALAVFNEKKAQLPPEAFQPVVAQPVVPS